MSSFNSPKTLWFWEPFQEERLKEKIGEKKRRNKMGKRRKKKVVKLSVSKGKKGMKKCRKGRKKRCDGRKRKKLIMSKLSLDAESHFTLGTGSISASMEDYSIYIHLCYLIAAIFVQYTSLLFNCGHLCTIYTSAI